MLNSSESIENKDLIIFGTGRGALRVFHRLNSSNRIICFVDSRREKQNTRYKSLPVIAPRDLPDKKFDSVVIASVAREEITKKLIKLGIPPGKILTPPVEKLPDPPEVGLKLLADNRAEYQDSSPVIGLVKNAVEQQFLTWPEKFSSHLKNKTVLDFGCGQGQHAIGFWLIGTQNLLGVDPNLKLDQKKTKKRGPQGPEDFGYTPAEIQNLIDEINYFPGSIKNLQQKRPGQKFDVITARYVTEHIKDLPAVLKDIRSILKTGGKFIFSHHNFYAWNGHHCRPRNIEDIDLSDPDQQKLIDWKHLDFDVEKDHYINRSLNKIRLPELRSLVETHFKIKSWKLRPTGKLKGSERFSPTLLKEHPALERYEFLSQGVDCVAIKE